MNNKFISTPETRPRFKDLNYTVVPCDRADIRDFIEEWHYSHNINGLMIDHCFKLLSGDRLIGAMIYGGIAMSGVWRKYADSPDEITELRRLVCVDDTAPNTESWFIAKTLKWLKKNTTIRRVISYADTTYGHEGVVYKASNFKLLGKTSSGRVIMYKGKRYHDKTIRTTYNGKLKPFASEIKTALENGEAYYVKTKPKNIYVYDLR